MRGGHVANRPGSGSWRRRIVVSATAFAAILGAACGTSEDDGAQPAGPSGTGPAAVGGDASAELEAILDELGAAADDMFPCGEQQPSTGATARGVSADTIDVALLDADLSTLVDLHLAVDIGSDLDHLQAFFDEVNEQCGGIHGRELLVHRYPFNPLSADDTLAACNAATKDDENFIVIARVLTGEGPDCVTEANQNLLFMVGGVSENRGDTADGRLFGAGNVDVAGQTSTVQYLVDAGRVDVDQVLGIAYTDSPASTAAADAAVTVLDGAGVDVVEVQLPYSGGSCDQYTTAVQRFETEGVEQVLMLLDPLCPSGFVQEATNQSWFPTYLVNDFGAITTDVLAQAMAQSGDAFDGATAATNGLTMAPDERADIPVSPWNEACVELTNSALGESFEDGDDEYGAISQACSLVRAMTQGLEGAGPDLTQDSFVDAMQQVEGVPLHGYAVGSFGPGQYGATTATVYELQWSLECTCWSYVAGPAEHG